MRYLALILLPVLATFTSAADNWPQFRGPNGDGHATTAATAPATWSEKLNIRWKAAIHDKGWSSPVVWGEQIWVTTATETGTSYFAVCLNRKTGAVIHDLHLFDEPNPPDIKQYNSFASPTPAIEAGRLYAHFGSHGTFCLDTSTGNKIWERRDLPCNHWRGPASSPVIHKDRLILLFDGHDKQYVVCLNKATGKTIWEKPRVLPYPDDGDLKKAYATPSIFEIDGKVQVVAPAATGTIAYDVANGDEIWRVIHGGMNEAIRPIFSQGLIFLNSGHTKNLLAVRAGQTGDLTRTGIAWRADKIAPTRPSVIAVGEHIYFANDDGVAFCFETKTGTKVWQERLDGKFSASPVYAAGNLYFPSENGKTFVVAASPTFNLVAENRLDAGCKASPAVAGDALFLRTFTHLYCLAK